MKPKNLHTSHFAVEVGQQAQTIDEVIAADLVVDEAGLEVEDDEAETEASARNRL